jgi:hypothetical protein
MVSVTMTTATSSAITSMEIYPNPNKGSFMLALETPYDEVAVMVLNNLGQMIFYNDLINTTGKTKTPIDLGTGLATGTYFVKVTTENETYIKHMVIE